jgi:hypothetical protein
MSCRFFTAAGVLAIVTAAMSLRSVPVAAQAGASRPTKTSTAAQAAPLRTPDGKPDLQGVWNFATITPLERPAELAGKEFLTDAEVAALEAKAAQNRVDRPPPPGSTGSYNQFWMDGGTRVVGNRRTSLIVDPPDGKLPPYTPEGQKRRAERTAIMQRPPTGPEDLAIDERCILGFNSGPPMISGAYNNNVQILQSADYVVLLNEMNHDARIVPTDGRPHGTVRQWSGDSRGRWEGNTLVVETKYFRPEGTAHPATVGTRLEALGENLHLIERFTRVDAETLNYEFTINDPTAFTRPWSVSLPMTRTQDRLYEYACHEGNYSMTGSLAGARAVEKGTEAARTKTGPR